MPKPNQTTIDRAVYVLREAGELARRGEPILLQDEDVRALVASSVVQVRNALKRKLKPSRRKVNVEPINLDDMRSEFEAEVAAVRRGSRMNHSGRVRRY